MAAAAAEDVPLTEVAPISGEHAAAGQTDEVSPVQADFCGYPTPDPGAGGWVLQDDL